MTAIIRRIARSLCVLLLMVSYVPVQALPCVDTAAGEVMPCCVETGDHAASLDGDCCALRERAPLPDREGPMPAAPNPTAGAPAQETSAGSADLVPVFRPALLAHLEDEPPLERLYLRLSNFRV